MEGLLVDLATHPGFVAQLLRGIADYVLQTVRILCERFEFDAIAISDDYGTQKAMLISPRDWRRFIKPVLAEIYALAKKHDCHVFHHTCGNVVPIIPDLIEIGLDILHPIQPEAMDIFELKREFGRDLTFCGGLRTQDLLPCASPQEIRAEVGKLQREMGRGGGYILEPGITLQSDIPLDNLLAMIDEAQCAD
jgi:uroporphyrinogen decarboxylase